MIDSLGFEQGGIRPPDEANSLLIRTTRSCPWNRCSFCTLFKGERFSIRKVKDIKKDIYAAKKFYGNHPFQSAFLQDGDSFAMKTDQLVEILNLIKRLFPTIKEISSYGRAQTMARKSREDMERIFESGLNMLYSGMESGSDEVLKLHNKGTSQKEIINTTLMAQEVGMRVKLFFILGLGGRELSKDHIRETASLLNIIKPKDIRVLSLAVKDETPLQELVDQKRFTPLTETEMVEEERELIYLLDRFDGKIGNYHSVNLLT